MSEPLEVSLGPILRERELTVPLPNLVRADWLGIARPMCPARRIIIGAVSRPMHMKLRLLY